VSVLLLLAGAALAGSGPWTLQPGHHNVYVGADYGGFREISNGNGGEITLGTPIRGGQVLGAYTAGIADGLDVEVVVPVERAWATQSTSSFCLDGRPPRWCATTTGLGDVGLQLRYRLLDEAAYRPVTLSVRLLGRSGAAYARQRSRLTTIGDGQTDVALGLAIGRTDVVDGRWYRVSASTSYWYRFGVGQVEGRKAPADEISFGADAIGSPVRWVGVGVALAGFNRLGGVDLTEADIGSDNAWVGLDAAQVRVGPKLAFYTDSGWTFFSSVMFTAATRNSPRDLVSVSVGIGRYIRPRQQSNDDEARSDSP
jgi:hypothetical protein